MISTGKDVLPIYLSELDYILEAEKRILYKPVSRDVALALGIPVKKCRKLMRKYAPDYILDHENLHYWNGEVPQHIVDIFGEKIIEISKLIHDGVSLKDFQED